MGEGAYLDGPSLSRYRRYFRTVGFGLVPEGLHVHPGQFCDIGGGVIVDGLVQVGLSGIGLSHRLMADADPVLTSLMKRGSRIVFQHLMKRSSGCMVETLGVLELGEPKHGIVAVRTVRVGGQQFFIVGDGGIGICGDQAVEKKDTLGLQIILYPFQHLPGLGDTAFPNFPPDFGNGLAVHSHPEKNKRREHRYYNTTLHDD